MNKKGYTTMVLAVLISACQPDNGGLEFTGFKNLELGFTTQNFMESVPVTKENSIGFIDYAAEKGFSWVELRDPDAVLTLEECKEISKYAESKSVGIAYAIQKGPLDADYWGVFNKGVVNASVFKGSGTFRSLACGGEFDVDPQKKGWDEIEFEQLLSNMKKAAKLAGKYGLQMVFENGNEAMFGDGSSYSGLNELFENTNETVGWQFDVANPFSGSRGQPSLSEVRNFLNKYKGRLHYIHLKSSVDREAQECLTENPLPFEEIFRVMDKGNIPYVAIELVAVKSKEEVMKNMDCSLQYLKEAGFIK